MFDSCLRIFEPECSALSNMSWKHARLCPCRQPNNHRPHQRQHHQQHQKSHQRHQQHQKNQQQRPGNQCQHQQSAGAGSAGRQHGRWAARGSALQRKLAASDRRGSSTIHRDLCRCVYSGGALSQWTLTRIARCFASSLSGFPSHADLGILFAVLRSTGTVLDETIPPKGRVRDGGSRFPVT